MDTDRSERKVGNRLLSARDGFQKARPKAETMPSIEKRNVFAVETVMARQVSYAFYEGRKAALEI